MKTFVKATDLKLVNGGYLTVGSDEKPVNNKEFIIAQKKAEYIVTFAKLAKGKKFNVETPDSIAELRMEVAKALETSNSKKFVSGPEKPSSKINDKLKNEALAFMSFGKESVKTNRINDFLSELSIIDECEEFGLYFDEDIVKLNKIYTMEEVTEAVKETIDLL